MKRTVIALLILSITATACGNSPSLWGTYFTPTPYELDPLLFSPDIPPTPPAITPIVPNVSGNAPSPLPQISTNTAPAIPSTPANGQAPVELTVTPTFDLAAIQYTARSGDTIPALAKRFNVKDSEIVSSASLPATGMIDPGTLLLIPDRLVGVKTTPNIDLIPDSEIVFSASALDFNIRSYIQNSGGYLNNFREYLGSTGWANGYEEIERLAYENSINPRLILAMLEYEGRWVRGQPIDTVHAEYPMGFQDFRYKGMFIQMVWAINQISIGYYGWRAGTVSEIEFPNGEKLRLDPHLDAGTVALMYLFSRVHNPDQWTQIMDPKTGFMGLYKEMFGDPWARAELVNPIFPAGLTQPPMVLPFEAKNEWNFTGGPHGAWEHDGSLAAVDFAPSTDHGGCDKTKTWVVASSPGLVVRSGNGVVVVDMDGDGHEQTGWDILYLHIAAQDRVALGTWLETNDRIGHASCEGGVATGTHVHFARKYNGEWVAADGPIPMVLDGWRVVAGAQPYEGKLIRADQVITADPFGQKWSNIFRDPNATATP